MLYIGIQCDVISRWEFFQKMGSSARLTSSYLSEGSCHICYLCLFAHSGVQHPLTILVTWWTIEEHLSSSSVCVAVQSVPITTYVLSSNPVHGEENSIQKCMIKFVSDLRQVGGLLRVLLFPPPMKLTATI
jgi:hypothetical protein